MAENTDNESPASKDKRLLGAVGNVGVNPTATSSVPKAGFTAKLYIQPVGGAPLTTAATGAGSINDVASLAAICIPANELKVESIGDFAKNDWTAASIPVMGSPVNTNVPVQGKTFQGDLTATYAMNDTLIGAGGVLRIESNKFGSALIRTAVVAITFDGGVSFLYFGRNVYVGVSEGPIDPAQPYKAMLKFNSTNDFTQNGYIGTP